MPIDPTNPHHQLLAKKQHSECKVSSLKWLYSKQPKFGLTQEFKVGLATSSYLLLGCVDLLEGQYRKVADECTHCERVKANMVASLAERVYLSVLKCGVCHIEYMVLHTLNEYNRHLREKSQKSKDGKILS